MTKKKLAIAIIGGGFTGLAAAHKLARKGIAVTIFESSDQLGGLATSFKDHKWNWSLEKHYHHLFASDEAIQRLSKEVNHKIIFTRPKTSTFYQNKIKQIDSPISLLTFEYLPLLSRLRTGLIIAFLKINPFWKSLEQITASNFLKLSMGKHSWQVLWRPLLYKKFGKYSKIIPASWFWARIKSRTASLGYPEKGFKALAQSIASDIKKNGGKIKLKTPINQIDYDKNKFALLVNTQKKVVFDRVICTLPTNLFLKIVPDLPKSYFKATKKLTGIGAINLVITLNKSFLTDNTYWLNINDPSFPFLAVVEHTNFISSEKYNNQKIIYIANYLESHHPYFNFKANELLNIYFPFLKKINQTFQKKDIKKMWIFKAPFAQPIVFKNYSAFIPPLNTPFDGLYLANIQQVYPWDRGTNYAVELGNKVVDKILK